MPFAPPVEAPPAVSAIVIQGAVLPDPVGDAAFSVIVVSPAVLRDNDRLDDALATVSGFSLYRRTSSLGANPTTQGVSLRGIAGSGASRTLVTLDGAPVNDPFGGWVMFTSLPTEAISSATLVRGAGSGAYGAGALTGVVALQSPQTIPGGSVLDVEGGQTGYGRAAGVIQIGQGATRAFFDASTETSAGWIPVIQGRGPVDQPLALHDFSAAERVEANLGRAVLTERIGLYQENRNAGTEFARSRERGGEGSLSLTVAPTATQWGWRLSGWASGSDLRNTTASVALGRQTATLANNQYSTPAYGVGVNAAARRTGYDFNLEIGLDARAYDGHSDELLYTSGKPSGARAAGGGEAVAGMYVEASKTHGPWLFSGGLRLDGWADYNSTLQQTGSTVINQSPPAQGGALPTGRFAVRRDLSEGLYLRAAAYSGFRPATLNELHRPFRVGNNVTLANAALRPEQLYGAELGAGGKGWADWSADVFFNQLANAITNVTIGRGPGTFPLAGYVAAGGILYERENAGRIDALGFEGDVAKKLGAGLRLSASLDYTRARVDGGRTSPQLTGLRPALTPDLSLAAAAHWQVSARISGFAEVRYESDRFDDDLNTLRIKGGASVNARLDYALRQGVFVYLAADNLLNAELPTAHSAAGIVSYDAPRAIRGGLSLRL